MIRAFPGYPVFLLFSLLFYQNTEGQQIVTPDRNSVALNDLFVNSAWSAGSANPAQVDSLVLSTSLQEGRTWSAGVYSARSFMLSELNEGGLVLNMKLPASAAFCTAFSRKGYELFHRNSAAAGLIRNFGGQLQTGIRFEYVTEVFGEGYGSRSSIRIVTGILARLTGRMDAAAVLLKPLSQAGARYAPYYAAGLQYRFSTQWTCSAQLISRDYLLNFGATFHYHPIPGLSFMGGIGGRPTLMAMGCTVDCRRMRFYISASHRQVTGLTPSVGFVVPLP